MWTSSQKAWEIVLCQHLHSRLYFYTDAFLAQIRVIRYNGNLSFNVNSQLISNIFFCTVTHTLHHMTANTSLINKISNWRQHWWSNILRIVEYEKCIHFYLFILFIQFIHQKIKTGAVIIRHEFIQFPEIRKLVEDWSWINNWPKYHKPWTIGIWEQLIFEKYPLALEWNIGIPKLWKT